MIPQPVPAGPVLDRPEAKLPGLIGIWIGVVLIVAGVVLGIVLAVGGARTIVSGVSDLQRLPIDQGGTVQIDDEGQISVYAERLTLDRSSGFTTGGTGGLPPVALSVYGPDGEPVPVAVPGTVERYTWDQHEGVRIATFGAERAGTYEIVPTAVGAIGGYRTLAVGPALDLGRGIVGILGGIFGGGLVIVIGVVVLIVSSVRRSRARRATTWTPSVGAPGGAVGWAPPPVAVPSPYGSAAGWAPPPPSAPPPPGVGPGAGPPSSYVPPAGSPWVPPPASGSPAGPPGWVPPPAPPPPGYGEPQGPTP
ncbi:MAG TPA: hypothetical protein P5254_15270 [Aquihabitans sp.]|nr:hypothetical protein [Aquihabitans sp.]